MASKAGSNARPIIIVRRKKRAATAHHGGAWKVAYADFVTAMMAFFMLLWLISNPDKARLKGLAEYFSPSIGEGTPAPPVMGSAEGLGGASRNNTTEATKAKGTTSTTASTAGSARGGTANVPASLRVVASELQVALEAASQDQGKNTQIESSPDGLRITLMDTDKQSMFRSNT